MNNFTKKINTWYKSFRTKKNSYVKAGMHPRRDWNILIICICIVIVCFTVFAFYFYNQVESGKVFITKEGTEWSGSTINNDLLEKVLQDIHSRQENLEQVNKETASDPAI